jgi:adenylate cyclase, class 2
MTELACNIELKARVPDLAAARKNAQRVATRYLGVQQQTDTYFYCPQGRMKLREIVEFGNQPGKAQRTCAQLISYDRADQSDAKESHYQLVEIRDPARVRELKAQMGIRGVVVKRREIFLYENARIHLDEVTGLGTFLEFEAVLSGDVDEDVGREQVNYLEKEFGISPADLVSCSYADLLAVN